MNEPSALIRQAFQEDQSVQVDRERLWNMMMSRNAQHGRWRQLVVAGLILVAGAIVAGAFIVRQAIRTNASMEQRVFGPAFVVADSISSESPTEQPMIQATTEEAPSNLVTLLGHRTPLRMELIQLSVQQDELAQRLNRTGPGPEHAAISAQLANVEHQIEAAQVAIEAVDRQIAAQQGGRPVLAPGATAIAESPQAFQFDFGEPPGRELIWMGGGIGTLLTLGMVVILIYMRRLARSTRDALSLIEGQVASQHATLASGIDAIAVEVERLGEEQRFMSKTLAGERRVEAK